MEPRTPKRDRSPTPTQSDEDNSEQVIEDAKKKETKRLKKSKENTSDTSTSSSGSSLEEIGTNFHFVQIPLGRMPLPPAISLRKWAQQRLYDADIYDFVYQPFHSNKS